MGLLDATDVERADAMRLLGQAPDEPAPGDTPDEPAGDAGDAAAAKPDAPEEPADEPEPREAKRFAALTARLTREKRQREALQARLQASEAATTTLMKRLEALESRTTEAAPNFEEMTPDQIRDYYEKREQKTREQADSRVIAARVQTMLDVERRLHDGGDGQPSFDEMLTLYRDRIEQDDAFVPIKAKIQSDTNPAARFYKEAMKLFKAEQADEEEETTHVNDRKDAARVGIPGNAPRNPSTPKAKLSEADRATANQWFPGVKTESIEKARAKALKSGTRVIGRA